MGVCHSRLNKGPKIRPTSRTSSIPIISCETWIPEEMNNPELFIVPDPMDTIIVHN